MYDLIVLGAGPGGYEAAAHAGDMGKKVAIIEKQALGGVCLNAGCIPVKTWLRSAGIYRECLNAETYGIKNSAPAVDFSLIQQRKNKVVALLVKGVEGKLKRKKVEIFQGTGSLLSPHSVAVGSRVLEADHVLIATGSRAAVPPVPGITAAQVMDATRVLELETIPRTLAVIGAGAIGLEFAVFFAAMGTKVRVIEWLPRIAGQMDTELGGFLQRSLEKQGIRFSLASTVAQITGSVVTYTDKEGKAGEAEAEVVLNATGRTPNVEDIGLDAAGIDYDKKGIKTDLQGKTNVPGVWACGDVTGRCLLAHAATREGIVAVNNMFGRHDVMRYNAVPNVLYTHPEAAGVGSTEQELLKKEIPYKKSLLPLGISGRFAVEYAGEQGYVKVLAGEEHHELLGIHILGGQAGELIYGAAAFIEAEFTVDDIKEIVFPHPAVSEAIKEAIIRIK